MIRSKLSWAVVVLCGFALGLRAIGLEFQSLWRDEVDALRFAGSTLPDLLVKFGAPGENGPLYFLVLRPWLEIAGQTQFSLRFFSVACGVLAVPLVYRLGRRLFPSQRLVPLGSAIFVAVSPYLVWYSQEGKMYALTVLLVLLSMERFTAASQEGGWGRWLTYVAVTVAGFYVHLVAVLVVPAQVVAYFFLVRDQRRGRRRSWAAALAVLALLAVLYIPLLTWEVPLLWEPGRSGFAFVPLHRMLMGLLTYYGLGIVQTAIWWKLLPFVLLLTAALAHFTDREMRGEPVGLLYTWLLAPVAVLFVISLRRPVYTARYLAYVLPALYLLLAAGASAIARWSRLLVVLLTVSVLVLSGWGLYLQAKTPLKADWRSATDYVARGMHGTDLILFQIPYGQYSFEFYFSTFRRHSQSHQGTWERRVFLPLVTGGGARGFRMAEGLYTNAGMDPTEASRRMTQIVGAHRIVWFVETEAELWDERGLVKAWLDANARLTAKAEYVRIAVYRYEMP